MWGFMWGRFAVLEIYTMKSNAIGGGDGPVIEPSPSQAAPPSLINCFNYNYL
jgi:hypothetical protein